MKTDNPIRPRHDPISRSSAPTLGQTKKPHATAAAFEGASGAVGVGYVWGDGVLTSGGNAYLLMTDGLNAVCGDAEKITAKAEVNNLRLHREFPGGRAAPAELDIPPRVVLQ